MITAKLHAYDVRMIQRFTHGRSTITIIREDVIDAADLAGVRQEIAYLGNITRSERQGKRYWYTFDHGGHTTEVTVSRREWSS